MTDGVIQYNTKTQVGSSFIRMFEATYTKSGDNEYLYGNLYDYSGNRWVYSIKRISTVISSRL